MLLPQSEAFSLVKGRLACVPHVQKQDKHRDARKSKKKKFMDEIDFPSLLEHFQVFFKLSYVRISINCTTQDVVTKHQMARRKDKTSAMLAKGGHSINIS